MLAWPVRWDYLVGKNQTLLEGLEIRSLKYLSENILRVAIRFSYRLSSHGVDHREKKEVEGGGGRGRERRKE